MKFYNEEDLVFPVGSAELDQIIIYKNHQAMDEGKYDEFIPAFKNVFHTDIKYAISHGEKLHSIMKQDFTLPIHGVFDYDPVKVRKNLELLMKRPLASINGIELTMKRSELDSTLVYSQLVVAVLVQDKSGRVLLLENTDATDIGTKMSMVQGHCSYNTSVYTQSFDDYLIDEAMREFHEEVILEPKDPSQDVNISMEFKTYIALNSTPIDVLHCGFLYSMIIDDFDMFNISSKEPDKHEVKILTPEDILVARADSKMDSWVFNIYA